MKFKLVKILGGRINVPEIRTIPVKFGSSTPLAIGDVLTVSYGAEGVSSPYAQTVGIAKLADDTTGIGVYVVAEAVTVGTTDTAVKVYDITPEMVFEAVANEDLSSCIVGVEYACTDDGYVTVDQTGHGAHHTTRGVVLYDKTGATAQYKPVLVTFPRA